jgi:hypothetical protein
MMLNQNTITYQAVSDDPWMPAHEPVDDLNSSYIGDYDLNLLGCAEQPQICNPNAVNGAIKCTQLSGGLQVQLELASIGNKSTTPPFQPPPLLTTSLNSYHFTFYYNNFFIY